METLGLDECHCPDIALISVSSRSCLRLPQQDMLTFALFDFQIYPETVFHSCRHHSPSGTATLRPREVGMLTNKTRV